MVEKKQLSITFLGAASTVTGSKYLITYGKKNILIDCGLFQGLKNLRLKNWQNLPLDVSQLDAVILTHAHIDHSGYLPLLVKQGYQGPVYCTLGTKKLCEILLPDAAHLQEEEARYLNKHRLSKHHPALPLYNLHEALKSLDLIKVADWDEKITLDKEISFVMKPMSHILGAARVELTIAGRVIVFSGDIGRDNDPLLSPKSPLTHADYLLVESTYGDRDHLTMKVEDQLEAIIKRTLQRGGSVIIPTFAVGRAQMLLYYIHQLRLQGRIPPCPIYLNSPMAVEATHIHESLGSELKRPLKNMEKICNMVQCIVDPADSKKLNEDDTPAIILSSSGMMTGGRILHIINRKGQDPKNCIVLAGFQSPGTRGEALAHGKKEIRIFGQYVPINAEVICLENISAHADRGEIITWLQTLKNKPKKVFVVHGEAVAADEMRKRIEDTFHWDVVVPTLMEKIDLL